MNHGRGLPTRNRAGAFGRHMWSRRWAADLEASADGHDVRQARVDARRGHVLSLDHSGRLVRCDVASSRPRPFEVEFAFAPLDAEDTRALRTALRGEEGGILGALTGRYSDTVGFLLLPAVHGDTSFSCRCPVQPGPCRHILAAAYLMVEWWDRAPEVLFALRGLGAADLGAILGGDGDGGAGETADGGFGDGIGVDVEESLWGEDPLLPVVPSPAPAGLEDLLDTPVTRRLAAAASADPLEQMRVVADLEDCLDAFSRYRPGWAVKT